MEKKFSFKDIVDNWARERNDTHKESCRNELIFKLLQAFWLGEFENGESVLTLDISSGIRSDFQPVNRRLISRILPVGEFPFRDRDLGDPPYEALAKIQIDEYPANFFRIYFSRFTISRRSFIDWFLANESEEVPFFASNQTMESQDEIGQKIMKVIHGAARKKKGTVPLSNNRLAEMLAPQWTEKTYEGFGFEAIRKILYGTYEPARRRGIPSLDKFLESV